MLEAEPNNPIHASKEACFMYNNINTKLFTLTSTKLTESKPTASCIIKTDSYMYTLYMYN